VTYIGTMEQDIIKPGTQPKTTIQGFSPLGCTLASIGAGLLAFCLLGATAAAASWAIARIFTFDQWLFYALTAALLLPVATASLWIGARAWAVEQMLARGQDVAPPVFSLSYYLRKPSGG
jgi:hypothetical protein